MRVNEQGRSMIEMLGVLAIVGVLSVGGIAGYSKAMNKFKTNKVIDQVNMISTNIRTLFSSQRTYSGLCRKTAVNAGLIPSEMTGAVSAASGVTTDVELTNAFGGKVDIRHVSQGSATEVDDQECGINTSNAAAYVIIIDSIPKSSCITIATTDWGGDSGSGLVAMAISTSGDADDSYTDLDADTTAAEDDVVLPGDGLPYGIVEATNACASDKNVIAWKYM